jgi:hypothetical protein
MFRLLEFWRRYSTFIVTVLAFLFLMDYCGRIIFPTKGVADEQQLVEQSISNRNLDGTRLKSYEEIMMDRRAKEKTNWPLLSWLAAAAAVGFAGYYAHKKGWLKALIPGSLSFRSKLQKDKSSGRMQMRLTMSNTTHSSETFLLPHLLFKKSSEIRRFKIKSDDFPLTLTPGTSHSLLIDVHQFWDKVPDLERFTSVGAEIDTTSGRVFKTRIVPKWQVF